MDSPGVRAKLSVMTRHYGFQIFMNTDYGESPPLILFDMLALSKKKHVF